MAYKLKPSWLLEPTKLKEIVQHHLFLPQDIPPITSLQDSSAFLTGLKRFLFWKDQLAPSLKQGMIFLALLGPQGLKIPDVLNVTTALHDVIDISKIVEFYRGADTHFMALSFDNQESVTQILAKFRYYEDSIVLAVTYNDVPQYRFKLLWLPPLFDVARVHHLLNKHSLSHRLRRESIKIANGKFTNTNVVSGFLTLKPGIEVSSLPHLIQLPSPHRGCALLTIDARPPLCLKCREVGHTRQKCTMVKCLKCTKVHFPSSPCGISSYSSVASRNITSSTEEDWINSICDDDVITPHDSNLPIMLDSSSNSTCLPLASINDILPPVIHSSHNASDFTSTLDISSDGFGECDRTPVVSPCLDNPHSKHNTIILPQQDFMVPVPSNLAISAKLSSPQDVPVSSDSPLPLLPSLDPPNVIAVPYHTTYNRRLESSKVHIIEQPSTSSLTARSQLIDYSVAPNTSITTYSSKLPVAESISSGLLFGDPDPDHVFSSDSDSSSGHPTSMDFAESFSSDSISRKRKNSSPFNDGLPSDADLSPPSSIATNPLPATSILTLDNATSLDISDITPGSSPLPRSALFLQVSCLYGADETQIMQLESACPNGTFTADIFKTLKFLYNQGFGLAAVLSRPQILIIRLHELKKKLKYIAKHQGSFTIEDLWQQSRTEARASVSHPPPVPYQSF